MRRPTFKSSSILPNVQQQLLVDPGEAQERAVRGEDAVGGNGMDVGMVVDQLAEGLDAGNHAGDDIATIEHLPINLDGGLPSGAGQFAEQTADRGGRKFAAAWGS